ncbi:MazG-like nucleoside triphosphate pyrophosphohydrolase [Gordonia phage Jumbo]|uniref:MazG-like nucleoside triphosphate pyrophosphohydrolase n=1 Tax=Gordonia phage Jumbo TaxID=1887650 RepID=A0A1B3B0M7_9CAUD|nr:pyrophosphatase [Gordonia phage Jumbo]AOE44552.1 MazG-like nucleoside triphosphate pyrophosphohydrolase [Gordonia phage Jumbo]
MTDQATREAFDGIDYSDFAKYGADPEYIDVHTGTLTDEGAAEVARALRILATSCWLITESKGFHDSGRGFPEEIALMHSELSEALESHRSGEANLWYHDKEQSGEDAVYMEPVNEDGKLLKPEGVSTELADTVVRIPDSVATDRENPGHLNFEGIEQFVDAFINKTRYNATRPYKHGRVL